VGSPLQALGVTQASSCTYYPWPLALTAGPHSQPDWAPGLPAHLAVGWGWLLWGWGFTAGQAGVSTIVTLTVTEAQPKHQKGPVSDSIGPMAVPNPDPQLCDRLSPFTSIGPMPQTLGWGCMPRPSPTLDNMFGSRQLQPTEHKSGQPAVAQKTQPEPRALGCSHCQPDHCWELVL
jgi:hypothetical protein